MTLPTSALRRSDQRRQHGGHGCHCGAVSVGMEDTFGQKGLPLDVFVHFFCGLHSEGAGVRPAVLLQQQQELDQPVSSVQTKFSVSALNCVRDWLHLLLMRMSELTERTSYFTLLCFSCVVSL